MHYSIDIENDTDIENDIDIANELHSDKKISTGSSFQKNKKTIWNI